MTIPPVEFDLQPDPRILPMLGEISLAQWRCLAELVDNSVDGFLSVLRAGVGLQSPEVHINLPTQDTASARITISDNGPGMTPDTLERAVRAGWSGNNPIDSLGMFGMGFNIATARLGAVTTVWTSRRGDVEEHGLTIDFEALRRQRHFKTPRLTQPKVDPNASGTKIVIDKLKPEQRAWFAKAANRSSVKQELSKAYSAMLRPNGVPMTFKLELNGRLISATNHCVWNEDRSVESARHGTVFAVQKIDRRLPDRPFCTSCWQWLAAMDTVCPACNSATNVTQRKRHVHGWVGLQRYVSAAEFGIDFIRNGRKIEIANKDLFYWRDPDAAAPELEYPIDDPRGRGRFVGEIHLDHCRVTYTKDHFDRADPAWDEMTGIVRGEGPLQPQKASSLGYTTNDTVLFKLYQAFRRNSPQRARVAGGWANVLVVKDNDRAEEMAKKFHDGEPEYQTDQKWWELVEEEDNKLLTPPAGGSPRGASGSGSGLAGFSSGGATSGAAPSGGSTVAGGAPGSSSPPPPPTRTPIPSLSREYVHDVTRLRWKVTAMEVEATDPDLVPESPWLHRKIASTGQDEFLFSPSHPIFRSATMTPLDALLCELAHKAADFSRNIAGSPPFAQILADLRSQYGGSLKLDPVALLNSADLLFRGIARAWSEGIDARDAERLFGELSSGDREQIQLKMASRTVPNPARVISEARFLEYAPPRVIVEFVLQHPEFFFDGKCWDDAFAALDYMTPTATEVAQKQLLRRYDALLADALWISEQDAATLEATSRERLLRASLTLELLAPSPSEGSDEA